MRAAVALTVVLASLLAGCTDEKSTTQTTQAAATTEAADTNAAQAAPAAGFEDDFSTEDGKWPSTKGTWGTALTFADQYQITLNGGNDYVYVGPAAAFGGPGEVLNPVGDSTQAVEVSSEAERINVGLMCRWNGKVANDTTRGYTFTIASTANGTGWGIKLWDAPNPPKNLGGGKLALTLSDANALGASCAGEHLKFTINGNEVADVIDATLASGKNGIVAARSDEIAGDALAQFDNYKTTR